MKGHHPGATWRKADLQCHTARDHSWRGQTQLPATNAAEEAARETWADEFIAACVAKGLHVIAVTDHHDLCMAAYVQRAAERDGNRVLVFPGVEVTCSDDAQCLAIIEPTSSPELRTRFVSLRNFTAASPALGRTPVSSPVNMTVVNLFEIIQTDSELRDNSVLLPHFSDDSSNAHKHINRPRTQMRFINLDCDGVYIEKPFSELDEDTKRKAYGKVPEWGTRRRAIIPTGDNRYEDWGRLGKHDCWIKLGENSIEGLRQALLADEARIAVVPPVVPGERLVSLTVKSDLTGAEPLSMTFNEGFTALIGGRGSGKSSILEYLRFALARTNADFSTGEKVSSGGKEQNLIEETLGTGFVEVELYRDGIRETWNRTWNSKDHITVTDSSGATNQLTISDAQRKFRARGFYQKGLSTTVNDPASAADQITGIAAAEVLERRREIEQEIEKAQLAVRNALGLVAAHWLDKLEHRQARSRADDVRQRLQAVTDQLDDQGVSVETKSVLAKAPHYSRARSWLLELDRRIVITRTAIDGLKAQLLDTKTDMSLADAEFEEMSELTTAVDRTRVAITVQLDAAMAALDSLESLRQNVIDRFATRSAAFDIEYSAAVAAQSAHTALIEESSLLTQEHEAAVAKIALAAAGEEKSVGSLTRLQQARQHLEKLVADRRCLLQAAAEHVAGRSSQRLEAQVKPDPAPSEYIAALCRILQSSYVSDPETKCTEWVKMAVRTESTIAWPEIVENILNVYEAKVMASNPADPSTDISDGLQSLFFGGGSLSSNQTKRVYGNLNDGTVGELLAAVPRDYIYLRYIDDQGRRKPFDKASPGQQASALLELLLQQSAGTLIIDQPEDDLDNRVVMKIVELIKTSKSRRQLIFTTHNPNIVVNGDADKVIALETNDALPIPTADVPEITIDVDGAIETPAIRMAITRIMEGGKDAFELRRRKYRFDQAT